MAARDQWIERVKPTNDEARGADGKETDLCAIPFPLALHCVGSVLAVRVRFAASRPGWLAGRSERRAVYEGKGGLWVRAVWTGRKGTPIRSYQPP